MNFIILILSSDLISTPGTVQYCCQAPHDGRRHLRDGQNRPGESEFATRSLLPSKSPFWASTRPCRSRMYLWDYIFCIIEVSNHFHKFPGDRALRAGCRFLQGRRIEQVAYSCLPELWLVDKLNPKYLPSIWVVDCWVVSSGTFLSGLSGLNVSNEVLHEFQIMYILNF